jgi:hypothetical protein
MMKKKLIYLLDQHSHAGFAGELRRKLRLLRISIL